MKNETIVALVMYLTCFLFALYLIIGMLSVGVDLKERLDAHGRTNIVEGKEK